MTKTIEYSLDEIDQITQQFAQDFPNNYILCLEGEMGAGKTTFIKSLCERWGVVDNVSSPTYSIINKYACEDEGYIYHLDLFRLEKSQELIDIGFEDMLDEGNPLFIEWPELAYPLLKGENILKIKFEKISEKSRKIVIFT